MSEIINLIENNPDSHVYAKAVNILSRKLETDYSFIMQVWNHEMPQDTKYEKILISTSDESHQVPSQANDPSFVHIFKQYVPMEDANNPSATIRKKFTALQTIHKVTPMPLCHLEGVKDLGIPILEREYDSIDVPLFHPSYHKTLFVRFVSRHRSSTAILKSTLLYGSY